MYIQLLTWKLNIMHIYLNKAKQLMQRSYIGILSKTNYYNILYVNNELKTPQHQMKNVSSYNSKTICM